MSEPNPVALNDLVSLAQAINSGSFLSDAKALAAQCGTMCGCVDSMCGCKGSVTAMAEEQMKPSELEQVKQRRLMDLRQQLVEIESEISATKQFTAQGADSGD